MQGTTNSSNCKRLLSGSVEKLFTIRLRVDRRHQTRDSARIPQVFPKSQRQLESLISCLPEQFLRSIEADQEVVVMFLKELWPHIVGEELARNTEPSALNKKVLKVLVPSAVWASELASLRSLMMASINRFWGVQLVETIRLEVDLSEGTIYGES